jgi:uncharacterized protein with PIN domain
MSSTRTTEKETAALVARLVAAVEDPLSLTDRERAELMEDADAWADEWGGKEEGITPEEVSRAREAAREEYGSDDVQVYDDANVSRSDEGSFWVEAYLWVRPE